MQLTHVIYVFSLELCDFRSLILTVKRKIIFFFRHLLPTYFCITFAYNCDMSSCSNFVNAESIRDLTDK